MKNQVFTLFLLLASCFVACTSTNEPHPSNSSDGIHGDSVLFSFAFVGCNRIQSSDTNSKHTNSSTANIPELQRTFDEVAKLSPKPKYFFFLGDLVLGLKKSSAVLNGELEAWLNQAQDPHFSLFADSDIRLVAIPGNHEMLYKDEAGDEVPWKKAISVWQQTMAGLMPLESLNRVTGEDSIANQQTYSFDYMNVHFIMLNTDTWNEDSLIGSFPLPWVESDIIAASMNDDIEHTFILSHKPVWVSPNNGKDDTVQDSLGKALWKVMKRYHVEAMFSAHSHQYQRSQRKKGESVQIIAGNGGSLYTSKLSRKHQFMGYCVANVMQNGDIEFRSMGRCIDAEDYLDKIPKGHRTLMRDTANLRWGAKRKKWPKALLNKCNK